MAEETIPEVILGALGLKRLVRNYAIFFATLVICALAFFKVYELAGWDPPLVTAKAYAIDKASDDKRITALEQNFAAVANDIRSMGLAQLEGNELTLQSRIQDLDREIAKANVAPAVMNLLLQQRNEARQRLGNVRAKLGR